MFSVLAHVTIFSERVFGTCRSTSLRVKSPKPRFHYLAAASAAGNGRAPYCQQFFCYLASLPTALPVLPRSVVTAANCDRRVHLFQSTPGCLPASFAQLFGAIVSLEGIGF